MKSFTFLALSGAASAFPFALASNYGSQKPVSSATSRCPSLHFDHKCGDGNYPCASGTFSDVTAVSGDVYEVTFNFDADHCADLSNLGELKIIGLDSPDNSTVMLYSRNSRVHDVTNPCRWSSTFRINAEVNGTRSCTPSFQVQYDWFSGSGVSTSQESSWSYASSYDYLVSCSADNHGNSNGDWAQYCWEGASSGSSAAHSSASSAHSSASSAHYSASSAHSLASASTASHAASAEATSFTSSFTSASNYTSSGSALAETSITSSCNGTVCATGAAGTAVAQLSTVTASATTVITITSCSGGCTTREVTTGVSVGTTTVGGTVSEFTTYCPLTATITPIAAVSQPAPTSVPAGSDVPSGSAIEAASTVPGASSAPGASSSSAAASTASGITAQSAAASHMGVSGFLLGLVLLFLVE